MLAKPVAGAVDLDDDGMVQEAIKQCGRDDGIAEDISPFGKAAVCGQDHRALLVSSVDEVEEEIAAAGHDGEIADLVDDEQRRAAEEEQAFAKASFSLGLGETCDEFCKRAEVDAPAGFDRLDAESDGQVALVGSWRAEKVYDFAAGDEPELGKCQDAVAVERGLEGEVEAGQRLDRPEASHAERRLDPAVLAQREFFRQENVDGFEGRDLTLFEPAHGMV